MAVDQEQANQPAQARAVGLAFARLVRGNPAAERLWVFSYRDVVQLWLLTPDMPADDERRLYRLVGRLYEPFPELDVRLHLISPRYFEPLELDVILPPGSQEIALNAA
jgi:hypothetical protein